MVSGDMLSQQTHRRALVGVPWQPATASTEDGNARDWLPAAAGPRGPSGKASRAGSPAPQPVSPGPPPPPASKVQVWEVPPGTTCHHAWWDSES